MKKILIFGYFGYENFGDEFLLDTVIRILQDFVPENEIYVLYNTKKSYKIFHSKPEEKIVFIPRWNFKEIVNVIKTVDTVICCGGLFQDKTRHGFGSLMYYTAIVVISKFFQKKVLLLGTEFEIRNLFKPIFLKIITNVEFIGVRNKIELENLLPRYKVEFFPDLCFWNLTEDTKKDKNKIKVIGLIVKKNKKVITEICKQLLPEYKLIFFPFHLKEDYKFVLNLIDWIDKNRLPGIECHVWDSVKNYKELFSGIDFIITSRFHGVVVAMLLKIPFLCLDINEKIKNFVVPLFPERVFSEKKCSEIKKFLYDDISDTRKFEDICKEYRDILKEKFLYFKSQGWI